MGGTAGVPPAHTGVQLGLSARSARTRGSLPGTLPAPVHKRYTGVPDFALLAELRARQPTDLLSHLPASAAGGGGSPAAPQAPAKPPPPQSPSILTETAVAAAHPRTPAASSHAIPWGKRPPFHPRIPMGAVQQDSLLQLLEEGVMITAGPRGAQGQAPSIALMQLLGFGRARVELLAPVPLPPSLRCGTHPALALPGDHRQLGSPRGIPSIWQGQDQSRVPGREPQQFPRVSLTWGQPAPTAAPLNLSPSPPGAR